jgi:signal peptidase I
VKQTIMPVGILFCVVLSAIADGYKMGPESKSMIPTIKPGDRVDVDKAAYRNAYPARWDAVILRFPDEPKWEQASRIIGLPGERRALTDKLCG